MVAFATQNNIQTTGADIVPIGANGAGKSKLLTAAELRTFASLYSASQVDTLLSAKQATLVSGTNLKSINGTTLLGSGDLTISATPAGSSGQLQFNSAGAFGGAAALAYAASGTHLTITSQAAATVPFCVKGAASQSGNLSEWRNSAGTILLSITSAGVIGNVSGFGFSMDTVYGHAWMRATTGRHLYIGTSDANQLGLVSGGQVRVEVIGSTMRSRLGTWLGEVSFQWPGAYIQKIITNIAATSDVGHVVKAFSGQTANLSEWQNSSGTVLTAIAKNGALKIVSLADSAAENSTLYYSTDAAKLVWKDAGGTVNALY